MVVNNIVFELDSLNHRAFLLTNIKWGLYRIGRVTW